MGSRRRVGFAGALALALLAAAPVAAQPPPSVRTPASPVSPVSPVRPVSPVSPASPASPGSAAANDTPTPPAIGIPADGTAVERVTFAVAVQRALARNPTAIVADEEIRRSRALMEEVRASSLPTLAGNLSYTRLDRDRVSNFVVLAAKGALGLNATLNVPLVFPRGWVRWSEAVDQIDISRANAADVRRTVAIATARAYLAILEQKRLVETAIIARDTAKSYFEFTRAQLLGDVGSRLDEVRAAQVLTADEVSVQSQEVALVRAQEALGVLVASDVPTDAADEDIDGRLPTLAEALSEAPRNRQDLRARERAASAADSAVGHAWADYVPYLNLIALPLYNTPGVPSDPNTGWSASLILTIPIYDGGLRYGQDHERKAIASEAHTNVDATLRQARSDVRTAFEEVRRADVALDQAHQSAAFARKALDLATIAYRGGVTTNLEVIDAQLQSLSADTQAAIAEDASRQARLDLLAASGRFP